MDTEERTCCCRWKATHCVETASYSARHRKAMQVVHAVRAEESSGLKVAIIIRSRFLSSAHVVRSAVVVVIMAALVLPRHAPRPRGSN